MINGENIRFRKAERDDIPLFVSWFEDPEIRDGLSMLLPISIAEEKNWFDDMLKRPGFEQPLVIEIFQDKEWITIGNCSFHNFDWRNRSVEVGIVIGEKSYWNKGYGTKSMKLLLSFGFQTLNLHRISLKVFKFNPRAVRCYEKAGFSREGIEREALYRDGQYTDIIHMSVLRSEWKE